MVLLVTSCRCTTVSWLYGEPVAQRYGTGARGMTNRRWHVSAGKRRFRARVPDDVVVEDLLRVHHDRRPGVVPGSSAGRRRCRQERPGRCLLGVVGDYGIGSHRISGVHGERRAVRDRWCSSRSWSLGRRWTGCSRPPRRRCRPVRCVRVEDRHRQVIGVGDGERESLQTAIAGGRVGTRRHRTAGSRRRNWLSWVRCYRYFRRWPALSPPGCSTPSRRPARSSRRS